MSSPVPSRTRHRQLIRFLIGSLSLIASLLLALLSLIWIYHFRPQNRIELPNPLGKPHRASTENCGFVDVSILLRSSDWPWTFSRPAILDGLMAEPGDPLTWVHWSEDGSVLAVRSQEKADAAPLFSSAYDYRCHKLLRRWEGDFRDPVEGDHRIAALMESRGGVRPPETGIDDGKYSEYPQSGFPPWAWIFPGSALAACIMGGRFLMRKLAP